MAQVASSPKVTEEQPPHSPPRGTTQAQLSPVARSAIMTSQSLDQVVDLATTPQTDSLAPPDPRRLLHRSTSAADSTETASSKSMLAHRQHRDGLALNDTPATSAPTSPTIPPKRQDSGDKINRRPPTTLDIPGLTKSAVSPDGRIAQRDVGSKLVIVMVGLPARGKSYITKKMARYLNWLQHDTKIFNVGERRRVAATGRRHPSVGSPVSAEEMLRRQSLSPTRANGLLDSPGNADRPSIAATMLMHGNETDTAISTSLPELRLPDAASEPLPAPATDPINEHAVNPEEEPMEQSASFFDPHNEKAKLLRDQVALETLDELLDYILYEGGSVGILDATNSSIERRKVVMRHIRARAGPDLNVLFVESVCVDPDLLERNMRLKLSGPDYKNKDPEASLADFKKRVQMYMAAYVELGDYEEKHNMPYVKMIDVGRKVISHRVKGFLSSQAVYYLLNFNLAPRQIWITRHGESEDNKNGKIGGDSDLTPYGRQYAWDLAQFLSRERKTWEVREIDKRRQAELSPLPGDITPPNPHYAPDGDEDHIIEKNFCVWTSMLKRSINTAQYFDDTEFDVKQMRMLDEINAGTYEGFTYEQIKANHREEFDARRKDKLGYRYPGQGGESYLDVINRLKPVIVELERMTDHVLLIGHRSIARILLAYFKGLGTDEVTDLDVPIGTLYCLEPKPYGVIFRAYRYDPKTRLFKYDPEYKLQPASNHFD